jgi:hypothetical protein
VLKHGRSAPLWRFNTVAYGKIAAMLDAQLSKTEAELGQEIAQLRRDVHRLRRDMDKLLSFLLNATRQDLAGLKEGTPEPNG